MCLCVCLFVCMRVRVYIWVILLKQASCWAGSLKPEFFKYAVLKFEFANTVVMYCYLSKKGIMSLPDSFICFIIIIFFSTVQPQFSSS